VSLQSPIAERLNASRRDLLDLGLRNSLLNYHLPRSRGAQVSGVGSADVVRWLVEEERSLDFVHSSEERVDELFEDAALRKPARPTLPTSHDEKNLQARLLATYYAARTHIEERGVNILFVAVGMLHWFEDDTSLKELKAPLLLIPVELERTSAREKFKIKFNGEDVEGNLSLATKLKSDFGIRHPEIPEADTLDVGGYFKKIAKAVAGQKRWKMEPDEIAVGFFSFAKFLMYRDLEPAAWCTKENPDASPILAALIRDGFRNEPAGAPDEGFLDKAMAPDALSQVVDVDSSQALAMLDVRSGRNVVIQGPPGTGKSQTITNVIADALAQGKKVLFVAEKLAALEVVKRRLDRVGLGDACLELHSHGANKKTVLADLHRTLQLGKPRTDAVRWELSQYKRTRDHLNAYCLAVNTPVGGSGLTPRDLMGELIAIGKLQGEASLPRPAYELGGDKAPLGRIIGWNRSKIEELSTLVANLQLHLQKMGPPSSHPFRATRLRALLPSDREAIVDGLRAAIEACRILNRATEELAGVMGIAANRTRAEADVLVRAARRALSAPHLQGVVLKTGEWQAKRDQLAQLIGAGARHAEIHKQFDEILIPEAWEQDLLRPRQVLNDIGRKWWRWFSSDYRRTRRLIAGLCIGERPKDAETQLNIVDAVMGAARQARTVSELESLGAHLYGVQWQDLRSDWQVLKRLADWIIALYREVGDGRLPAGVIDFLAGNPALGVLPEKVTTLESTLPVHDQSLSSVLDRLALDEAARQVIVATDFPTQGAELTTMLDRIDELVDGITYQNLRSLLNKEGLDWVVAASWNWPDADRLLVPFFLRTWFEALLRQAYSEREVLRTFDGPSHEGVRERFRELDLASLKATRMNLADKHYSGLPEANGYGQVGILLREFEKRSRHLPIRKLMQQAGNAIQAIKPVFMMSPMSIAAFVPPGSVKFDLVVFDEASQVKPVDAFGAVLRGDQVVVVGDSKQLPPTSFFDALVGEEDPADDEEVVTSDVESLLGLMLGQGAPSRMLRWHYRSRHQSLITLSNEQFYDNRLVVFPSPEPSHRGLGLVFHHLPNTVYDRGKSRTNRLEAELVAKAVMLHAKGSPHLTLGVAAFSIQQAEAVLDQLERLRRDDPSAESFFSAHPFEPFFVKNLESVQGDERDVIFISVGYGRNLEGFVAMNFGALNGQGGERRLNVLITRARQCCEVFTNLTHGDIDLNRTPARGVAALKAFLKYAQTGITDVPDTGGEEEDSPFEREVAGALRDAGHDVVFQVGSGGFRIDLAVRDPKKSGSYLLGIECDGATYHSSRSSRDRDRLRQQVLENLGWRIHRIWSTDWFNHQKRELQRTLGVIEQATLRRAVSSGPERRDALRALGAMSSSGIERVNAAQDDEAGTARAVTYELSAPNVSLRGSELHEVPSSRLAEWIVEVVKVEGPVHKDEVARRIADAAGIRRIGNRIEVAISTAISSAVRAKLIERRQEFLWPVGMKSPTVRDRSGLPNSCRKLEFVSPEEIAQAILAVIASAYGIDLADVPQASCRLLGFARTSEEMTALVDRIAKKLVSDGKLEAKDGHVTLADVGELDGS
jgi:very-short-patch-repair endonuclease